MNGKIESKLTSKKEGDSDEREKFWNEKRQLLLVDNYMFSNTYEMLIHKLAIVIPELE